MPKRTGPSPVDAMAGVAPEAAPSTPQVSAQNMQQATLKKVKREPINAPTPSRNIQDHLLSNSSSLAAPVDSNTPTQLQSTQSQPTQAVSQPQLQRQRQSPEPPQQVQAGAPKRLRTQETIAAPKQQPQARAAASGGIAWALSTVRGQLESEDLKEMEGVTEQLERFPLCVLLGGIAARRELVSALLGDHGHAQAAAASLVAPGMRQPVSLELRTSDDPTSGAVDLSTLKGAEAENWIRGISDAAAQALGNRLKLEPLRLRLSAVGSSNIDILDLPERAQPLNGDAQGEGGSVSPKLEEMRKRFLGSSSNLLVCLEPGSYVDLCRRFDPQFKRTVLLGAASAEAAAGQVGAAATCGARAARALEDRFAQLCHERLPQWLQGVERLQTKFQRQYMEAREAERCESGDEVLRQARSAGLSFGRALQTIVGGAQGCPGSAQTLEEELQQFALEAERADITVGPALLGNDTATAAADLFSGFGGVSEYTTYLREGICIPGADVALDGGAAFQRLLAEIEVAVRLAHPPPAELTGLALAAVQCGGTGVHGHQRWEEVSSKLMLSIAFGPLLRRIRYVAARVAWLLKKQKHTVEAWMATLKDGPAARLHSPLFPQHLVILRSNPMVRDLVFSAFDSAVISVSGQVLQNLQGTLTAGCINPQIMLRPKTQSLMQDGPTTSQPATTATDAAPSGAAPSAAAPSASASAEGEADGVAAAVPAADAAPVLEAAAALEASDPATNSRQRVKAEIRRRSESNCGLPLQLHDRVFEPSEVDTALRFVEAQLRKAFEALGNILANQAFAFADTTMGALCRRHIDEAMNSIDFSPQQRRVLDARQRELRMSLKKAEVCAEAARHCVVVLKGIRVDR